MMNKLVALCSFLIIFQLSIAASTCDPKQGETFSSKERKDEPAKFATRGVVEFSFMVLCHLETDRPWAYYGYGCYCGLGGKGEPKDDTDRCCQVHDECYRSVSLSGDCPFSTSIAVMPYTSKNCYQCEPVNYYWFYGECRHALCKCDSEAVQCFKRSTFNPALEDYPQDQC